MFTELFLLGVIKMDLYNRYSTYLKNKYDDKVYKLPINLNVTCPNRDGKLDSTGCSFCGAIGTGFENLSNSISITDQIEQNKQKIQKKYKAKKFIAYLQNFTNTYMPFHIFKDVIINCIQENIVEIAISTRPDCIYPKYLSFLKNIKDIHGVEITIELGLQTVNYHTLEKIHRGHSLAEFIDAVQLIRSYGFQICTHVILNLPWDDELDVIENAKVLSSLHIHQVKIHSLYILKDTILGKQYENQEFTMISLPEYKERVMTFLSYLDPNITVQRLVARAPKEYTLFANWNTSWWKIRDEIEVEMTAKKIYQGIYFHYLMGERTKFNA